MTTECQNNNTTINAPKENLLLRFSKLLFLKERQNNVKVTSNEDIIDLLDSINAAKNELTTANINFEFAESKEIIDYYTYKIKACQVKYNYLIKLAKNKDITVKATDFISKQ